MNFDKIDNIPLHPLVVHAPVVIIPIVMVGILITSFKMEWHKRFSIPLGLLTFIALVASYLAKESGEYLEEHVRETRLMEEHAEMGDAFFSISLIMAVLVAIWCAYPFILNRVSLLKDKAKFARIALSAVTILFCVYATFAVYQVGHSGAKSVWDKSKVSEQNNESEDDD